MPPALGDPLPWICSAQWPMQEGVSPILQKQGSSWAQLMHTQFEASIQEVTGAYLYIPNTEQALFYPPHPGIALHNPPSADTQPATAQIPYTGMCGSPDWLASEGADLWNEISRAMSSLKNFWDICRWPPSLWKARARKEKGAEGAQCSVSGLTGTYQTSVMFSWAGQGSWLGRAHITFLRVQTASDLHRPIAVLLSISTSCITSATEEENLKPSFDFLHRIILQRLG